MRRKTRKVLVGGVPLGGGSPVVIQSMTNTKTTDIPSTLSQIERLVEAGCEVVRLAVPNQEAVTALAAIRKQTPVPLIADIHFDYRLALAAMDAGADKIRINPGNIGGEEKLAQVIRRAASIHVPVRIGVNSGSLEKELLLAEKGVTVNGLVHSALRWTERCREYGATDLVVSLKSSDVLQTIEAYQAFAQQSDLPLHIGVTEAGTVRSGSVKSAVAMGILLHQGIGDTLRVSLAGDPVEEIFVARQILQCLKLRQPGVTIIACPTCGRTEVDMTPIAEEVERRLLGLKHSITVAVMGCEVNGPGEARHADIGVACGKNAAVLFRHGKIIRKIKADEIADELVHEALHLYDDLQKAGE
ncbi:flavodoxin-dependent (E)-4-hydroxy-3-methylbut-2-enyl-diphosphate synthase [bacterium]|nr:flavodoxin-dependent (E)-4-hydroxy-3-methylbut-2-enyl-diphosphate synthase [bacterium]